MTYVLLINILIKLYLYVAPYSEIPSIMGVNVGKDYIKVML